MEEQPNTTTTTNNNNNNNSNSKGSSNGAPASASSSSNSRWNPTKEQISMLEALYRQGVRTPTAEQIQQIAARLREFGTIEGKNVFYWFQNHKARQRQKQKQESLATLSRFFRRAAAASNNPVLPPLMPIPPPAPCANVVCSQFCYPTQGAGIAYYPQVLLPRPAVTMRATTDLQMYEKVKRKSHEGYPSPPPDPPQDNLSQRPLNANSTETLQLFPLHPTGVLEERSSNRSDIDADGDGGVGEEVGADARPVLSFF